MDQLVKSSETNTWTDADLSPFSQREIQRLAFYNGVTVVTPRVQELLNRKPWSRANGVFATEFLNRVIKGECVSAGSIGTFAIQKGQIVEYDKKEIRVHQADGDHLVIKNAMIPLPPSVESRPYLQAITAVVAPLVDIRQGEITPMIPDQEWEVKFRGAQSPIRSSGIRLFVATVSEVCRLNSRWADIRKSKKTLSGGAFLDYWLHAVTECPLLDYLAVHMSWIINVLRVWDWSKKKGRFVRGKQVRHNGAVIMDPTKVLCSVPKNAGAALKKAAAEWKSQTGNDALFFTGPVLSGLPNFPADGLFKTSVGVMRSCAAFRCGSGGLGGLVANVGFAGYMTDEERNLILIVSSAIGAMDHEKLDVYCESVGRVPIVVTSLKVVTTKCDWKVIVSADNFTKVDKNYKDYVQSDSRPGAHFVWICSASLPGDGRPEDILPQSGDIFSTIRSPSFTVYCPVFGSKMWENKRVFMFGLPFDFRGFVSTDKVVRLGGKEYTKDGVKSVLLPLEPVPNDIAWYNKVSRANSFVLSYFLQPMTPYSSICNVLVPPNSGAAMRYSEVTHEWVSLGAGLERDENFDVEEFEEESDTDGDSSDSANDPDSDGSPTDTSFGIDLPNSSGVESAPLPKDPQVEVKNSGLENRVQDVEGPDHTPHPRSVKEKKVRRDADSDDDGVVDGASEVPVEKPKRKKRSERRVDSENAEVDNNIQYGAPDPSEFGGLV